MNKKEIVHQFALVSKLIYVHRENINKRKIYFLATYKIGQQTVALEKKFTEKYFINQ